MKCRSVFLLCSFFILGCGVPTFAADEQVTEQPSELIAAAQSFATAYEDWHDLFLAHIVAEQEEPAGNRLQRVLAHYPDRETVLTAVHHKAGREDITSPIEFTAEVLSSLVPAAGEPPVLTDQFQKACFERRAQLTAQLRKIRAESCDRSLSEGLIEAKLHLARQKVIHAQEALTAKEKLFAAEQDLTQTQQNCAVSASTVSQAAREEEGAVHAPDRATHSTLWQQLKPGMRATAACVVLFGIIGELACRKFLREAAVRHRHHAHLKKQKTTEERAFEERRTRLLDEQIKALRVWQLRTRMVAAAGAFLGAVSLL